MKLLLVIMTIVAGLASCAQSKLAVVKSYGFFRQNSRGTQMVDENRNPINQGPDSQYVAYIETASTVKLEWTKAWIGNETFDIYAEKVKTPEAVGKKQNSNLSVKLDTKTGNALWKLQLQKGREESPPQKYKTGDTSNRIIVKGKQGNKDVYCIVNSIVELEPVMYP